MNGVVYIAWGDKAKDEAQKSITSLRNCSNLPVSVISENDISVDAYGIPKEGPGRGTKIF